MKNLEFEIQSTITTYLMLLNGLLQLNPLVANYDAALGFFCAAVALGMLTIQEAISNAVDQHYRKIIGCVVTHE